MLGALTLAATLGLLVMIPLAYRRTGLVSLTLLIAAVPLSTLLTSVAERLVLDRLADGKWPTPGWLTIGEVASLIRLVRDIGFLGLAYWVVRDVSTLRSASARAH